MLCQKMSCVNSVSCTSSMGSETCRNRSCPIFRQILDDSSLDMCITICITMPHTNTLISAPDLQINEEMAPDFRRKFTGAKNAFRLASFLRQKLAILNEALGCGRNDRHGTETSKSRKDTSVCRNVNISISASWFVGELESRRVGLSASWSVGDLVVGELVCRRVVQLPSWVGPTAAYQHAARHLLLSLTRQWLMTECHLTQY